VFEKIRDGKEIVLPYDGLGMLQHIHSADLANMILACMEKQEIANGQAFIAVAEKSMTLRAITENLYRHFGHTPNIRYLEWNAFTEAVGEQNALVTLDHISHSPCCTPMKAQTLLGVEIKYSIMDIFYEYIAHTGL
jgi:nucleoside-diphosphate-sugar epimerase